MVSYGGNDCFMTSRVFWFYFALNIVSLYVYQFEKRTQTCELHFKRITDLLDAQFKPQLAGGER